MPIVKDKFGIVVQHDPNDPKYGDGGDSARSMGIMALVGDVKAQYSLVNFVLPTGHGVRHPFQEENNNNDHRNFTRDQLLPLMAGLSMRKDFVMFPRKLFWSYAKRGFLGQNSHDQQGNEKPWYRGRDLMHPGHIGFMIQAARLYWLYPLLLLTWPFLILEILFHVVFTRKRESNQLLSMLLVSGTPFLVLYTLLDHEWKTHVLNYWSGYPFRDQAEIGDLLVEVVSRRVSGN